MSKYTITTWETWRSSYNHLDYGFDPVYHTYQIKNYEPRPVSKIKTHSLRRLEKLVGNEPVSICSPDGTALKSVHFIKRESNMAYSTYKTVILIDKTSELTRPDRPYHVQISRYETLRDKPHISHHQVNEQSVKRLLAWAKRDNFSIDSRYGEYGHWYAVKYEGE